MAAGRGIAAVGVGCAFGVIGPVMIVVSGVLAAKEALWLRTAQHATGRIVELRREEWQESDTGHHHMGDSDIPVVHDGYRAIFRFATPDGRRFTIPSSTVSNPPDHRVGDTAMVDYHSDHPERAALADWADRWVSTLIVLGLGVVFLLVGGLLAVIGVMTPDKASNAPAIASGRTRARPAGPPPSAAP